MRMALRPTFLVMGIAFVAWSWIIKLIALIRVTELLGFRACPFSLIAHTAASHTQSAIKLQGVKPSANPAAV